MVRVTRGKTRNDPVAGVAWSYAQTPQLQALLRRRETARATEINQAAGLAWRVYQTVPFVFIGAEPRYGDDGVVVAGSREGRFKLIATRRATEPAYYLNVRDDIERVIGIVKKRYRILQNEQAPQVLDQLVTAEEVRYAAAGALHGGAQVWWLTQLPATPLDPAHEDNAQTHILLTNSHDGSTSLSASILSLHLATQTTLAWQLPTAARQTTIRHTDAAKEQALDAKRLLELATSYERQLAQTSQQLRQTLLTEAQFIRFLDQLLPTPRPIIRGNRVSNQRGVTMAENAKALISHHYLHNNALATGRGTLWGLVLACQVYSDHLTINRTTADATAAENRFKRLTSDHNLGATAFRRALKLLP
jgi:phage/plasmid-like protein (TIGR03299 family)